MDYYGHNRPLCDVLADMRKLLALKTWHETTGELLLSLVEEVQILGNRMEASLYDVNDLESLHDNIKTKKFQLKELQKEINEINEIKSKE